jgi:hypothetical protein
MSGEGALLDTLAMLPVGPSTVLGVLRDGGGTFSTQPFGDDALATLTAHGTGLLVLDRTSASEPGRAEFRLTRLDLAGDTVYSRRYPYQPVPLPRERVDSAADAIATTLHGFVGERTNTTLAQWSQWVAEAIYAPTHYTPVAQLVAGRDGTVWLALSPTSQGGPDWLVLSEEGEPVATVDTPDGVRVLLAERDALWGVERDELDVNYIVRYRVAAGG